MLRRVGLLGGTFDPPHLGHLVVAESARIDLELDEVRLLVAGDPWMKPVVTPARHRVEMARLATVEDRFLTVDARETRRAGPTYTVDTLEELHASEPHTEWCFLLGADATARMGEWHRIDDARPLARFVVVTRPGHDLHLAGSAGVERLAVPAVAVSSTELRDRYAAGRATRYLVPDRVDRYVREQRLYGVEW
ncbi:nicotinate-nucleotide adenylyltransferase [Egicoccus sp. AB-alg6-2]|uniref:nicotinate-nucleotide adenylyltransferase n=1 Tax=Egicoccus sp. AB-alg6-2 TaxID=3242692 RepID=UPI00359DD13A